MVFLKNKIMFLFLGFVVNGINNVNMMLVEWCFELFSFRVGFIFSVYDIFVGILGVIILYFGFGKNKFWMVVLVCLFMFFGLFIMVFLYFIMGLYEYG